MRHCFPRPGLLAASMLIAMLSSGTARAEPRAVLELFTSQGCSSCPAADKLLGELAKDPSIVAMSLSVDYWNYLGWKDTLAIPGHSKRQHAYASTRGDRKIYTPQVVVNGTIHVDGSDKAAIEQAIKQTRQNAATLALPVNVAVSADKVTVNVPAGQDGRGSGEVWLCAMSKAVPVAIARGENSGKTVTYHNVARRWVKLGDWSGKAETFSVPVADIRAMSGADAVVVFVQSGAQAAPGAMLGASYASLR